MPQITEEKIVENWDRLIKYVEDTFGVDRKDSILKLLKHFEQRFSMAPASAKEHFHNAWPGGLVDHTLRVIDNALKLRTLWKDAGAFVDFSEESVVFAALFHDFAKVGNMEVDYYIPNESEWHRTHQGKIYELNPKLPFMQVTDRVFWLLSQFNISYSENEFLAIRLADGMYAEINKGYLMGYEDGFRLKTNLPHVIHHADMMSMCVEYDAWKHSPEYKASLPAESKKPKRKETLADKVQASGKNILDPATFDELFNTPAKDSNGGK